MAYIMKRDQYYDDDRVRFIKCRFEDLPIGCKDVSIFMKDNTIFFVDNDTIPFQYDRILSKSEMEISDPYDQYLKVSN